MTFESKEFFIVAIYIWLPPASYVVFLTTLVIYFQPGRPSVLVADSQGILQVPGNVYSL